ncbi:MAG: C25 family cysteine peptidase, partial [Bacteroidota bacterium]
QVPIYIQGGNDGFFNSTDFIEFVGRKNDGRLETELYDSPDDQPNTDYSLFNDTLSYFISWNSTGNNLRFQENDLSQIDEYSSPEFVWKRNRVVYTNSYYEGQRDELGISIPFYTKGEGWMSGRFGFPEASSSLTVNLNTTGVFQEDGAPPAELTSVSAGVSNAPTSGNNHFLQIRYSESDLLAVNQQFQGYEVNRFDFNIPNNQIGSTTTGVKYEVSNSLGVASDYQAVASLEILYPHIVDLGVTGEFQFLYRLNTQESITRFDFQNIFGTNPRVYTNGSNAQRAEFQLSESTFSTLLQNSFGDDTYDCYLVTDETVRPIGSISAVANNGLFTNFGQAEVDSAFVIITHRSLAETAQAYASYRQQRFNTVVAEVSELYDQFGGGVNKSGIALRNFSDFLLNTWPTQPQYLLLLGKSVRTTNDAGSVGSRRDSISYARNLVPTLGVPSADNLITAGLANTTFEPAIRTGRVSANNQEELQWYLDKLQIFESQPPAAWMKNVMHFGGGRDVQEQNRFASYLFGYEQEIEDSAFGGDVHTFLKTSSIPIEINLSEEVDALINGGASMMTFFGHASSDGFDQTIDDPNNYEWNGKFPFLLGNGCYTGDYHGRGSGSTSEAYTILPNKGVIGFLASTELGFEGSLNDYSRRFYRYLSTQNYGGTVGDHIRKTVQEIQEDNDPENLLVINTTLGMSLQGDPAVVVNSWPNPDLSITEQDVFFTPSEITAETDSFTVNIVITNIGKATYQPFSVVLEHETPEGVGDSIYARTVEGLLFRDTVRINLPVDPQTSLGLHRFNVLVDLPENQLLELDGFESVNNQVIDRQLFISNGGVVPVYPYRFAVIDENPVTLRASTGDPLAQTATYRIEADTIDTFDSPALVSTEITQIGGVLEWQPSINYTDSLVVYWRCAKLDGEELVWRESSYQYIPNRRGWGQAGIFQFENNGFSQKEFNRSERQVDYFTGSARITNNVLGNSTAFQNEVLLNTNVIEYATCNGTPAVHLVVFDPITFDAWGTNYNNQNPQNAFGNFNETSCRERIEYFFVFLQNNPTQMQALADLLLSETIPDGHIVVLYSARYVSYDDWDNTPDIYDAFAAYDAGIIGSEMAQDSVPYSLITRKGDPSFTFELYGENITDVLNNIVDVPASGNSGLMASPRIGPASSWETISWQTSSLESVAGDSSLVSIVGITPSGIAEEILQTPYDELTAALDGSVISPIDYPFIELQIFSEDEENQTPRQVDRWHVLYDEVTELAVNPEEFYAFSGNEISQGEEG